MHTIRPAVKSLLVLAALLGLMFLALLYLATAAQASFRLSYAPGVERDGIAVQRVQADADDIAWRGRTASVTVTKAPPAPRMSIPARIVACESGGSYTAENPVSSASGKYQIVDGTWDGYGGYSHASDAPPHVQDAKAAELWDGGRGAHHWRQCL